MTDQEPILRRRELGAFLRARRERLSPAALGLPDGARRRTPGLKREEVAQLASLSVTWYTWIEQGRDVSVSAGTLRRLGDALRLDAAARAYLFALAGRGDLGDRESQMPTALPPALRTCLEAIACPAYLLDSTWTALAWNEPATHLFAGWLDAASSERNLLRFLFVSSVARDFVCDWETRAGRVAAEFRAACGRRMDDPLFKRFVADLRRESPSFSRAWEQRDVHGREGGQRTFNHPQRGFVRYEQVSFDLAADPEFRLTMLLPQG